ncbi:MAG: hypothetical protein SGI77_03320 [Pirellulaceae bacterium]|nr:hypothetical protein [Pirellulaceae bacterium]
MTRMPARNPQPKIASNVRAMRSNLESLLHDQKIGAEQYAAKTKLIRQRVLDESRVMKEANFSATTAADLRCMAEHYDGLFFEGTCFALARQFGLSFRWSSRMTKAGGKTTRSVSRPVPLLPTKAHYEIALSSSLIFQTFQEADREVRVCGCVCEDRLQAMQRIVEHETIHLAEMLIWVDSDCAAGRFQSIANRFFCHTEHKHELVTQRERAQKLFDIRLGSRVSFAYQGRQHIGIVNRITRRATVLVESSKGIRYSDGKQYEKFYIPIVSLKPQA